MELPGGGSAVPARGLVVHRVTPRDAQQRGTVPGIGIQFMDSDDEFRRRIDAAITHILETERAA
jgi:Tfp pilus assembly protein PilZ